MAEIFVSYRRADAKVWALLLRDNIVSRFGEPAVFLDRDALEAGAWAPQLEQAASSCKVFLLVIGPMWLQAADAQGRPRLQGPDDVHRREIETALAQSDVVVLPVLVDGAAMPAVTQLPASIRALCGQQAYEISDTASRRKSDTEALLQQLHKLTGLPSLTPESASARPPPPAPPPAPGSPWAVVGLILAGTAFTGVASSYADLPLSTREWMVVVVLMAIACYGGRAAWRAIRHRRWSGRL